MHETEASFGEWPKKGRGSQWEKLPRPLSCTKCGALTGITFDFQSFGNLLKLSPTDAFVL